MHTATMGMHGPGVIGAIVIMSVRIVAMPMMAMCPCARTNIRPPFDVPICDVLAIGRNMVMKCIGFSDHL